MKKFITIWIGCSLALAVGALAQQEDAQPTPTKKQHHKAKSAQAAQPSAGQPAQQAPPAGPHAGKPAKEHAAAPNKPHAHAPATEPTDTGANSNDAMKAEQKKSHKGQPVASESANTAHAPEATNSMTKSQSEPLPSLRPPDRQANQTGQGQGEASRRAKDQDPARQLPCPTKAAASCGRDFQREPPDQRE